MKPYHLAIIPDGNRRWARGRGIGKREAYEIGIRHIGDVLKWCRKRKVRMLSMWGFSTENFKRPKKEVSDLFGLFMTNLQEAVSEGKESNYEKHKVRVRFIGRREGFPFEMRQKLQWLEGHTKKYDRYFLNIFLGYGGRQEIIDAVNEAVKGGKQVDAAKFARMLYTKDLPEPDLIIRTSGEQRLSGFMPWQGAYSELYFSRKLWPDFSLKDFDEAIAEYARRKRRYGK